MNALTLRDRALRGERLTDTPIIDCHVHLGTWAGSVLAATDEQMIPFMDRLGVAKICVNGALFHSWTEGNDYTGRFARRFPDRAIPFVSLNPFQHNMVDELKRCVEEYGMRGVKLHCMVQLQHSFFVTHKSLGWAEVWKYCAQHKLPVLAHGIINNDTVKENPETIFIEAHGVNYVPEWREALRDCPNYYLDTASTQNRDWTLGHAVRAFGADRILYGTDAPLDDFAQRLGIILDSGLPEEDQKKILGLNAARLLGITH